MFQKLITVSLSPNTQRVDRWRAFLLLFQPWKWKSGSIAEKLEKCFAQRVGALRAVSFESGRSALFAILRAMNIGSGDEVIVQGYTCVVVANAVLYVGAKPVYVDIDSHTFNIDPSLIEKNITPNTKAIIVQHTFGKPADMNALLNIARKHHFKVIEDCAHALGSKYNGKQVGSFGDAALWSFGRDKVISGIHGGMATTNDKEISDALFSIQRNLPDTPRSIVLRQLLHPLMFAIILPLYNVFIGKVLLMVLQRAHILTRVMEPCEKRSVQPLHHPQKLSDALAELTLLQLTELELFHKHRLEVAREYHAALQRVSHAHMPTFDEHQMYLMFTFISSNASKIIDAAKERGILLGVWRGSVLLPSDCDFAAAEYTAGSCPVAERVALQAVNLPTHIHITHADAQRVLSVINLVEHGNS